MYNSGEMKRLLAYLFMVLGLTILFQSKSFAPIKLLASGCIEGNCKNGQGTYTGSDGSKYVGEFKDGKRNGQGTFTWANGKVDNGIWKYNSLVIRNNIKTQIAKKEPKKKEKKVAKKEPTQTQQVAGTDKKYLVMFTAFSNDRGFNNYFIPKEE